MLQDEVGKDKSRHGWRRSRSNGSRAVENKVGETSSKQYVSIGGDTKEKGAAV